MCKFVTHANIPDIYQKYNYKTKDVLAVSVFDKKIGLTFSGHKV